MNATIRHLKSQRCLLVKQIELLAWVSQANPGEELAYHRGFLAMDRVPIGNRLSESDAHELSRVATLAWQAAEIGIAHLVQRRLGPDDFSYVIVARERKPGALPALLEASLIGATEASPPASDGALARAA